MSDVLWIHQASGSWHRGCAVPEETHGVVEILSESAPLGSPFAGFRELSSTDQLCIIYLGFGDAVLNDWAFRLVLLCQNIYNDVRELNLAQMLIQLKNILNYR